MIFDFFLNLAIEIGLFVLDWFPMVPRLPFGLNDGFSMGVVIGQGIGLADGMIPVNHLISAVVFVFAARQLLISARVLMFFASLARLLPKG